MQKTASDTVVLIPSLEPDDRLPAYAEALLAGGFGHVVVVDDGSSAPFQPVFERIAAMPGCRVLHHGVNRGKGVALKTGYKWIMENLPEAAGVITADADGQHTVPDCIALAEHMLAGERALWLGSRDFDLPNVPSRSRKGNKITSAVFKLFYGVWLPDTQTGLRAFRSEELPFMAEVAGERYEYEMNVLIACTRQNLPMKTVTIETVYENGNAGSHFHPLRDSWRIYRVILSGFMRFAAVSLLCVLVDQALAALLREWLLPLLGLTSAFWLVNVSGWGARVISAVLNFLLNKNLVFRLKGDSGRTAWKYAAVCAAVICLSNLGVYLLGHLGMTAWLAKLLCDTVLFVMSYQLQQRWVFRGAHAEKKES